ncbi:cache domain-containing protein [Calothrix sp. PCC 6303]|uniref:cache domain-containing protein n=1 Tax=Calothrix sp. PCC 6303 TaxID=1170562 RepID=UPI0002A04DE9|nr:cache domain-containing protein [Calothrix sp. PCC 6303]AFZ01384.1 histidine kinase HAMP region domain protein [Calothrix sp. PCC 6303]
MPKLSLSKTLPIAFLVPLLTCVGLLGVTAVLTGQKIAGKFSQQSMEILSEQIKQRLNNFLDLPHIINQINTDAVEIGQLDLQKNKNMEILLWHQIQAFKEVNGIQFGSEFNGELYSVVREEKKGELSYNIADSSTNMDAVVFSTNDKGDRAKEISRISKYDARKREWYKIAIEARKAIWTPVFPKKTTKNTQLRLSAVQPVYERKNGKLLGVWSVDFFLNQISDFLVEITKNTSREIFIVEPNGKLIAASTKIQVFDDKGNQFSAKDFNQEPLIKATSEYIEKTIPGGFANIPGQKHFKFYSPDRELKLVKITKFFDDDKQYKGLNWLVVIVVPEKEFMQDVNRVRIFAIVMAFGVVVLSLFLGVLVTRWLAKPILGLSHAAEKITSEEFDLASLKITLEPITKRSDELGELADIFQKMAQEVYEREVDLKNKVNQLADRANKATLAKQSNVQELLARSQKARDKI